MQNTLDLAIGNALVKREGKKLNVSKTELIISAVASLSILALVHMPLLAASLGVSAAKAASIISAAYKAWKTGTSIATAISAVTGPGFLVDMAINILFTYGVQQALNSAWVHNL